MSSTRPSATTRYRAFRIPMRGNEYGEMRDDLVAWLEFRIPMRGNEIQLDNIVEIGARSFESP